MSEADGPNEPTRPASLQIRTARGDDLSGAVSVGHRTWVATYEPIAGPEYVAMGLAKWWTRDAVTASIRAGRTIVAVLGDEVIGVATVGASNDQLALWKLYVLPGHHGQGIGSALLREVERRAVAAGHRVLVLSHIAGNEQAARFYSHHGFITTHVEEGGSGMPDSVWMSKDLERAAHAATADAADAAPAADAT